MALTDAAEKLLSPLERLGAPREPGDPHSFDSTQVCATLSQEAHNIIAAQTARGARLEQKGAIAYARACVPLLVPLFASALRHAEHLGRAMDARCYTGGNRPHPLPCAYASTRATTACSSPRSCSIWHCSQRLPSWARAGAYPNAIAEQPYRNPTIPLLVLKRGGAGQRRPLLTCQVDAVCPAPTRRHGIAVVANPRIQVVRVDEADVLHNLVVANVDAHVAPHAPGVVFAVRGDGNNHAHLQVCLTRAGAPIVVHIVRVAVHAAKTSIAETRGLPTRRSS